MNKLENIAYIYDFIKNLNKSKNCLGDKYVLLEQMRLIFDPNFIFISNTILNSNETYKISNIDFSFGYTDLIDKLRDSIKTDNDYIFKYSQVMNIPFIINYSFYKKHINNNTIAILKSSNLKSGIAYHYKSPCNKGTYISIGFKSNNLKELNKKIFLLSIIAPHISNFIYYQQKIDTLSKIVPLTIREKQVFILFKHGQKPIEISTHLFITERTVRYHLDNIVTKLNANNKIHALSIAVNLNII